MISFFSLIDNLLAAPVARGAGIPRLLLESAGRRAGTDPRQARELRQAALAYLRVVR